MKLSTKARYGVRALLDLATQSNRDPVQIRKIAERQGISEKYLWHLLDYLRTAGLVRSVRGFGGGFVLAKDPSEIKLSEVFKVLEGPVSIVDCISGLQECDRARDCVTREIWSRVNEAVADVLDSITLADLVERHDAVQKRCKRVASRRRHAAGRR